MVRGAGIGEGCSGGVGIPRGFALAGSGSRRDAAGFKTKKPSRHSEGLYGIGRRPTLPPVGQYHRRGRA